MRVSEQRSLAAGAGTDVELTGAGAPRGLLPIRAVLWVGAGVWVEVCSLELLGWGAAGCRVNSAPPTPQPRTSFLHSCLFHQLLGQSMRDEGPVTDPLQVCSQEVLRKRRGGPTPHSGACPSLTPALSSLSELSGTAAAAAMAPPWVPAVGFTLVPSLGGFLGAQYIRGEGFRWYASLQKPPWHPPRWILAPIWGTLYSAMG